MDLVADSLRTRSNSSRTAIFSAVGAEVQIADAVPQESTSYCTTLRVTDRFRMTDASPPAATANQTRTAGSPWASLTVNQCSFT